MQVENCLKNMKVLICDPIDTSVLEYFSRENIKYIYNPSIKSNELANNISDYDGLLVRSRTKVSKTVIEKGKKLQVIARIGTGYDNIDVATCKKNDIIVVNAPDVNSTSVAELTIGLILSFLRDIPKSVISMKEGRWIKEDVWGSELQGKTVGVVGFGHVGVKVARLLEAFGGNLLIYSRNYKTASLKEVFQKSDIITIHLSLNDQTEGIIDKQLIDMMKPNAIFVNLARGKIVEEEALYQALEKKKILGAILDVFWNEPLDINSRWRFLENVMLTPHIGAATYEALRRASMAVVEDVILVLQGKTPRYSV